MVQKEKVESGWRSLADIQLANCATECLFVPYAPLGTKRHDDDGGDDGDGDDDGGDDW